MARSTSLLSLLIILSALLLASCTNNGDGPNAGKSSTFIGGTNGLVVDFEPDQPPDEVYDNKELPFDVTLRMANMGESDVAPESAEVRITGIRAEEFGVAPADLKKKPATVLTRTYKDSEGNKIDGAVEYVTFAGLAYQNALAGNQQFTVRADTCFKYTTKAVSKLCITRDILDTTYDKVCKVNEMKAVQNSGAPVQIRNFKEIPRGKNKVAFSFEVAHLSTGYVFKESSGCEYTTANERVVYVTVDSGMEGLQCSGWKQTGATTGFVTLYSGTPRTITCTQDVSTTSDYEQVVDIQATYDYLVSVEKRILVKHAVD